MIRRHLMTLRILLMLADFVLASVVFLLISVVRFEVDPSVQWSVGIDIAMAALLFSLIWVTVLWWLGLYRLRVRWSTVAEARDVARATVVVIGITLSLLFIAHQDNVSRLFLLILFVAQPVIALAGRSVLRTLFERVRRGGGDTSYMLIAGAGELAQAFADSVEAHPALGVRVIGHLTVPTMDGAQGRASVSRPILGSVDDLSSVLSTRIIDEVAVCLPSESARFLDPIIALSAGEGKTVRVPRDPDEAILAGALQEEFDGFLLRSVIHDGQRDLELVFKRFIDVIGATVAVVVCSPVMAAAAIAISWREGAPILFRQTRVGRHGRPFEMLKFRTMSVDAEERFPELAELNEVRGAAFKMSHDPRITRLGRFLRRWSIDELPQLLNVLKGDMSLVGPRPALPREVEVYDIWHRRRLSVRPGMTGLWQVEARMNHEFDDRAELDLRYIDQWSLWKDLQILLRTVPAIFLRPGQ